MMIVWEMTKDSYWWDNFWVSRSWEEDAQKLESYVPF